MFNNDAAFCFLLRKKRKLNEISRNYSYRSVDIFNPIVIGQLNIHDSPGFAF